MKIGAKKSMVLSGYVHSGTISNAAAPFWGVKHSGTGREGGSEGIEEFLETVYVGFEDPFART